MKTDIRKVIKFGTDGWRAVISDTFTFENVAIVAQAISRWVNKDLKAAKAKKKLIAIGYDTRFLSKEYAQTVACVLAANGIKVLLSDAAIPTPALSYGVVNVKAGAGVMITASHNPGAFNGIKIKNDQGGGASKEITGTVESYLGKTAIKKIDLSAALKAKTVKMHNFKTAYLKFMKSYVNLAAIKKAKFKVIQDVMHGSGGTVLEDILKGSNIRLTLARENVNPWFDGGKPEPIPEFLGGLLSRMKKEKFDLGLVLDGDADRIAAVAPGGEYISPQKILGLITLHLVKNRGRKGGVVVTTCGTTMMSKIAEKLRLKFYETPVGFKYISDLMVSERIVAGGEEAGGIGVQDYIPERDGTLAGLLLLEMMVYQKKNIKQLLDQMEKEFGRYYYERADISLGDGKYNPAKFKKLKTLLGKKVVDVKDYDGIKLICEDESWLMLRPSGTEPLVRAYSESKSLKKSLALLKIGERMLKSK